jgi:putative acetyltransferase
MYKISAISRDEYEQVIELWDSSVRETHNFVSETDIHFYKSNMVKYLNNVNLYAVRDDASQIIGFMGTSEDNIELLFVQPQQMKKGIGKFLINYAVNQLQIKKVDVNEQNAQAFRFYQKMGFCVENRSEYDSEGLLYPILHMRFQENSQ